MNDDDDDYDIYEDDGDCDDNPVVIDPNIFTETSVNSFLRVKDTILKNDYKVSHYKDRFLEGLKDIDTGKVILFSSVCNGRKSFFIHIDYIGFTSPQASFNF